MQSGNRMHFLIGSDTREGFYSLYSGLVRGAGCEERYIVKSGHEDGRSELLRKAAERLAEEGYELECFRNAHNPGCIDAVYVSELKAVLVDGEMPHTAIGGAGDAYIDMGIVYGTGARQRRNRIGINALAEKYRNAQKELYRYLAAADELRENMEAVVSAGGFGEAVKARARRNAARELKKKTDELGSVTYRFLSISSEEEAQSGINEVTEGYKRVYLLDNEFGLASEMLAVILRQAYSAGYHSIACLDPYKPSRLEHVIIPEISTVYVSQRQHRKYTGEIYRHFRLDALPREKLQVREKARIKADKKIYNVLIEKADKAREEMRAIIEEQRASFEPYKDDKVLEELITQIVVNVQETKKST